MNSIKPVYSKYFSFLESFPSRSILGAGVGGGGGGIFVTAS